MRGRGREGEKRRERGRDGGIEKDIIIYQNLTLFTLKVTESMDT